MSNSVKIDSLELENVKRVKAVKLEPTPTGLTVIGGRNGQGKTSILDAIAWTLGGDRLKPSNPHREGSTTEPYLRVELSNGLVVERKGKNSALKVMDPNGNKSGQMLLDQFIEALALNLPKFMTATNKEKANTLLNIIGVGDKLAELEIAEEKIYNQRTAIGQMQKQKRGAAEEMEFYPDAPEEPISATELIQQQQDILARNGENQRKRDNAKTIDSRCKEYANQLMRLRQEREELDARIADMQKNYEQAQADLIEANKTAEQLQDESTAEIEASLAEIDAINTKVRTNQAREAAMKDAEELQAQYDDLTSEINQLREQKAALLNGAKLPLNGLTVEKGELIYNGSAWDCMSGSDQLRVATAIVRALKPECGFVLVDKLEQFDPQTLTEFGAWAQSQDLQIIGTRVSTGDECSIIIDDGYSSAQDQPIATPTTQSEQQPEGENKWVL